MLYHQSDSYLFTVLLWIYEQCTFYIYIVQVTSLRFFFGGGLTRLLINHPFPWILINWTLLIIFVGEKRKEKTFPFYFLDDYRAREGANQLFETRASSPRHNSFVSKMIKYVQIGTRVHQVINTHHTAVLQFALWNRLSCPIYCHLCTYICTFSFILTKATF